jgi:hypothetical protein
MRDRIEKALAKLSGNRPQHTLVYVGRKRLLRVDVSGQGLIIGNPQIVDCDCATADDLPTVLPRALMGLPRPARKLWVLYESLPFYTLTLPSSQVTDVKPEQLRQALLFELEQMAGIGTENKQLAYSLLGTEDGMNSYSVSLAPAKVFEQLHKAAKKSACRLYGLAYAGAVPRRLHLDMPPGPWARLEFWANGVVGLHGTDDAGVLGVRSFHDIPAKRLEGELERWVKSLGFSVGVETLVTAPGMDMPMLGDTPLSLENRDHLDEWLQAWASVIATGGLSGVPFFHPTVTPEHELNMTIGLTAAALAVCLVHYGWHSHLRNGLEVERDWLKKVDRQIKSLNEAIKKQQDKREGIVASLDKVKGHVSLPLVLDALRRRPAVLLRELALHRSDNLVIERIAAEKDTVVVEGTALKPTAANDLSALLESQMNAMGWQISPPEKKDMGLFVGGGPWSFTMRLTDNGLGGFVLPNEGGGK